MPMNMRHFCIGRMLFSFILFAFVDVIAESSYSLQIKVVAKQERPMATYAADNFKLTPDGKWANIPIRRIGSDYKNYNVKVSSQIMLRCALHYYGERCEKYCKPDPKTNCCSGPGEHVPTPDEGDSDKEAPCSAEPCRNNGTCQPSIHEMTGYICTCTELWTGPQCTIRRSACAEAVLQMDSDQIKEAVCLNEGRCVDNLDEFSFTCKCPQGWMGKRCELPIESLINANRMLIISATCCVLVACIALQIAYCIWRKCRARRRRRREFKTSILSSILSAEEVLLRPLASPTTACASPVLTRSDSQEERRMTRFSQSTEVTSSQYVPMNQLANPNVCDLNSEQKLPELPVRDIPESQNSEQPRSAGGNKFDTMNLYTSEYEEPEISC